MVTPRYYFSLHTAVLQNHGSTNENRPFSNGIKVTRMFYTIKPQDKINNMVSWSLDRVLHESNNLFDGNTLFPCKPVPRNTFLVYRLTAAYRGGE